MSTLPVACRAGHCTKCGRLVWRLAQAARDNGPNIRAGQLFLMWPRPESVYARLETPTGYAPGIAFCPACAPAIGELALAGFGPTVALDTAHERYAEWFTERWGRVRRLWLSDALSYEPKDADALMAQWRADREPLPIG